jgi:protein O-mannosyl-transferase
MAAKNRKKEGSRSRREERNNPSRADFHIPLGWFAALVVVALIIVYYPALHGTFIWDDNGHVTRTGLRSLDGLRRIWFEVGATQQYYPLLHTAFWIEHKLWGNSVLGYHLVNVLQHALSACLLLLILRRLELSSAVLAAAIFALHPVQVESVAWITEQKNTLSAVFYFAAALVYLRYDQERQTKHYVFALALFVIGLLTKTVVATLPAALLVVFWWQRGRLQWRRDVIPLIPWFVLGAVAGLFTAWVERKLIGAEGAAFDLTLLQRCLLAGRVVWVYLGKLFWPLDLMFIYPRWKVDATVGWQYLFPVGALVLVASIGLIRNRWRGPLAGFLFFASSLFPVLGFFNVYPFLFSFVADHFQYLSSVGIIVVTSACMTSLLPQILSESQKTGWVLALVLLATLGILTRQQSQIYSDPATLYVATLDRNPNCWMCHNNLGLLFANAGQREAAIDHYEKALALKPDSAEAHNNLGNVLFEAGMISEAKSRYEEALRYRPKYIDALNNLGGVYFRLGRVAEAKAQYEAVLRINPDYAAARENLLRIQE